MNIINYDNNGLVDNAKKKKTFAEINAV